MSTKWVRQENVVWEDLGDSTVLVNPLTRATWVLNETATFLWRHLNVASFEEIACAIARATGTEVRQVRADIRAFCGQLEASGMISAGTGNLSETVVAAFRFTTYLPPSVVMQKQGIGFRGPASSRKVSGSP